MDAQPDLQGVSAMALQASKSHYFYESHRYIGIKIIPGKHRQCAAWKNITVIVLISEQTD